MASVTQLSSEGLAGGAVVGVDCCSGKVEGLGCSLVAVVSEGSYASSSQLESSSDSAGTSIKRKRTRLSFFRFLLCSCICLSFVRAALDVIGEETEM